MFKVILFACGGFIGFILGVALQHNGVLPASFDARWVVVAVAFVGGFIGHYIDNNRESAQIARELEQDRIRAEDRSRSRGSSSS
jgi:hypothetical protein